jgi:hypothetical protein
MPSCAQGCEADPLRSQAGKHLAEIVSSPCLFRSDWDTTDDQPTIASDQGHRLWIGVP